MKVKKGYTFIIFGVISITGPVCGVLFGGFISSKLGGYNDPRSLYLTALLTGICVISSFPIPFFKPEYVVYQLILLWFVLFCGGFILPNCTGIMINTVDELLKTSANSVANASYNLFGYLPSPYVFGLISDTGGKLGGNKKLAMKANMSIPILCFFLVGYQAFDVWKK